MTIQLLICLLAVKELEIKTANERLLHLEEVISILSAENTQLYKELALKIKEPKKEKKVIGFKIGFKMGEE
jgi:hypothetical protein